jgi:tetratricopeptide (TPR) repeat protein
MNETRQARADVEKSLKSALECNEKHIQLSSRIMLGMTLLKAEPGLIHEMEQQILKGIEMGEQLGLPASYSPGYLWLGELYSESGRKEKALENVKKAESMFLEMGMDYWLGKAKEALGRLEPVVGT